MAAPTFVQETETDWAVVSGGVTSKTTAAFNVQAGDILVAIMVHSTTGQTLTASGGSLTWTQQQDALGTCRCTLATAVVDTSKSMTATVTRSPSTGNVTLGLAVQTWRSSGGVGSSNKGTGSSGAPSATVTTTGANSAIVVGNIDVTATSGTATPRTNAGAFTATTDTTATARVYTGYHADAGSAGAYAVGWTAPIGQVWACVGQEVLGAAAAVATPARPLVVLQAITRGAYF